MLFSRLMVINGQSTVSEGRHQCSAGGITAQGDTTKVTIQQTIIRNNVAQPPCGGGGVEETVHCLLDIDPLFVDPEVGDYHLRPDSPAVDAGTPEGAPETDIDGDPRPMGAGVDLGADEVAGETYVSNWARRRPTTMAPQANNAALAGR